MASIFVQTNINLVNLDLAYAGYSRTKMVLKTVCCQTQERVD